MKKIHKRVLADIRNGARYEWEEQLADRLCVVHVGLDPGGQPSIWFEVDSDAPMTTLDVEVYGTGQPFNAQDSEGKYLDWHGNSLGSIVHGVFVWHVRSNGQFKAI